MSLTDTIYALSTGSLPSGVAIVRVSGPAAEQVIETLAGKVLQPRRAVLTVLRNGGQDLDSALVLYFTKDASFTGEAVAEFHLHGGRAVVAGVLSAIACVPGTRPADPGEFTRRAFINGRLDLTAAEGVNDLIGAETEAQRRLALQNASGAQYRTYQAWRHQLIEARALIEADLDFADEGDVPGSVSATVLARIAELAEAIGSHLRGAKAGEIVRDGFRVAIAGEPNAGKSSLLNALARRDVAIVSSRPGTTRDVLEVALDLDGHKVVLADTAGLRETDDEVEQIGIARANHVIAQADLVLHLHPSGTSHPKLGAEASVLAIASKCDLVAKASGDHVHALSTTTGEGLVELLDLLARRAEEATASASVVPTQQRHVALLSSCLDHMSRGMAAPALEIQAEELRLASDELGRLTGAIGVEDLLDVIFSKFCIGK